MSVLSVTGCARFFVKIYGFYTLDRDEIVVCVLSLRGSLALHDGLAYLD